MNREFLAVVWLMMTSSLLFSQDEPVQNPASYADKTGTQHFMISAGIWAPTGNLQVLGNHPFLGFQWGFRHRNQDFNFSLDFRFIKSKNEYLVNRGGALYGSRNYLGGYLGFDYIVYLISTPRAEIGLLGGVGYDGFDLDRNRIPSGPYQIGSFNINGGIRYNVYSRKEAFGGLQVRYNLIHYKNSGGSSFSGNAATFGIFIGGLWFKHSRSAS